VRGGSIERCWRSRGDAVTTRTRSCAAASARPFAASLTRASRDLLLLRPRFLRHHDAAVTRRLVVHAHLRAGEPLEEVGVLRREVLDCDAEFLVQPLGDERAVAGARLALDSRRGRSRARGRRTRESAADRTCAGSGAIGANEGRAQRGAFAIRARADRGRRGAGRRALTRRARGRGCEVADSELLQTLLQLAGCSRRRRSSPRRPRRPTQVAEDLHARATQGSEEGLLA
jgi:hypothetical protein